MGSIDDRIDRASFNSPEGIRIIETRAVFRKARCTDGLSTPLRELGLLRRGDVQGSVLVEERLSTPLRELGLLRPTDGEGVPEGQ